MLDKEAGYSSESMRQTLLSDKDLDIDDGLMLSDLELKEQRLALEAFEREKTARQTRLDDFAKMSIVDYKFEDRGCSIHYNVLDSTSKSLRWVPADYLKGHEWTEKIDRFWRADEENAHTRLYLEYPEEEAFEPAPFGKHIICFELDLGRHIYFDVRDNETRLPNKNGVRSNWFYAHHLGTE